MNIKIILLIIFVTITYAKNAKTPKNKVKTQSRNELDNDSDEVLRSSEEQSIADSMGETDEEMRAIRKQIKNKFNVNKNRVNNNKKRITDIDSEITKIIDKTLNKKTNVNRRPIIENKRQNIDNMRNNVNRRQKVNNKNKFKNKPIINENVYGDENIDNDYQYKPVINSQPRKKIRNKFKTNKPRVYDENQEIVTDDQIPGSEYKNSFTEKPAQDESHATVGIDRNANLTPKPIIEITPKVGVQPSISNEGITPGNKVQPSISNVNITPKPDSVGSVGNKILPSISDVNIAPKPANEVSVGNKIQPSISNVNITKKSSIEKEKTTQKSVESLTTVSHNEDEDDKPLKLSEEDEGENMLKAANEDSVATSENLVDSPGAVVVMSNNRIALVVHDEVWYYKRINNRIYKESDDFGPKKTNETLEMFPSSISAAVTVDNFMFYFMRGSKYCKRPLILDGYSAFGINQTDWEETYEIDEYGNKILLNRTEESKTYLSTEYESHCIWRPTTELFGCDVTEVPKKLQSLCSQPLSNGAMIFDKNNIYLFTTSFVYVFSFQFRSNSNETENFQGEDTIFKNLLSVVNVEHILHKWKGFDPKLGRFFAIDNYLCNIIDHKYNCWYPNGHRFITEEVIGDYEIADEIDGDITDSGALIVLFEGEARFAKVVYGEVCYYVIKDNKCYRIGQCTPVHEDEHNFPPNIVAAIKAKDNYWYFFDLNMMYCRRKENDYSDCKNWIENKELFGCNDKELKPQLRQLCKNPQIRGGTHLAIHIIVFRGGKYWLFNNEGTSDKPFGELIQGGYLARDKWPKIYFPGGTAIYSEYFLMIYRSKWSRWKAVGNQMVAEIIREDIIEVNDDPDGDSAILIIARKNEQKDIHIDGSKVCFVSIRNGKCFWSERCITYIDDEFSFPPKTVGAIKSRENNWFVFDRSGKFCRRALKEKSVNGTGLISYPYV